MLEGEQRISEASILHACECKSLIILMLVIFSIFKDRLSHYFFSPLQSVPEMIDNIKTRNKLLQTYKFPSQPTLVVLGPLSAIRQVFIVLDDSRWEVSNVAEGFVGVFQMIFGLDTSYPVEARHLFLFLQRTLFGLEFNNDFKDDKGLSNFLKARLNEYDLFKS